DSRAIIVLNGTPANYEYWLAESIRRTQQHFPSRERIVFINAWNEWAEGCHLEPDRKYGRAFLEATLRVKSGSSNLAGFEDCEDGLRPPRTLKADLLSLAAYHGTRAGGRLRSLIGQHPRVNKLIKRAINLARHD